ncbi:pyocin knob domain-containing protein [Citrobacter koseri]|uniref:pyocin knob domain-containing protein n=1 Tax=Citrobacter koseri TaxID=545 RepID=UPI0028BD7E6A|nr:pyocin knob domain-containing protein [Citrobacter koseri]MDT7460009.1 pyocin knob domain-containing protein [Citrobacter koseri]
MLYNTGTISVSGNNATGTGTNWTAPASQIRVGQTIIVLSNPVQMFQITTINSATSLTVTPAASPALSGQKYGILVSDNLSVDGLAQSISQLINEYDENISAWETFALTSANQTINVTINGAPVSIPALGKLVQKGGNGAVPVNQGGTGATTAEDARTNLGLVDSNGLVPVTLGGTGKSSATGASSALNFYGNFASHFNALNGDMDSLVGQSNDSGGETYSIAISTSENNVANWPTNPTNSGKAYGWGAMMCFTHARGGGRTQIYVPDDAANLYFRHRYGSAWKNWVAVWTNRNTTVDSNGFIKRASPIVSVFGDGSYDTNAESEGAMVQRTGTGEYKITGIRGLNSDLAWGGINGGIEIPKDINGQPLIWIDYKVLEDGDMVIKTYHREHQNAPEFARNTIKGIADGEPVDIPSNTFVSVRVEMPESSVWNQRVAEAEKAMTETPGASAD